MSEVVAVVVSERPEVGQRVHGFGLANGFALVSHAGVFYELALHQGRVVQVKRAERDEAADHAAATFWDRIAQAHRWIRPRRA